MKRKLIIGIFIAVVSAGCGKYLDVYPKSSISEDQMFESEIGFQQALSGVYSQMAARELYGDRMTMGFVSALAQDYIATTGPSGIYKETRVLNAGSAEVEGHLNTIWRSAYTVIAGINKVINKSAEKKDILGDGQYALIRGEALALRAFMHFDLLRLFGPQLPQGAAEKAIPYRTTVDQYGNPPQPASEVGRLALADLEEAAGLLKDFDPVMTASSVGTRRTKMNYYAVKGLEARIRLYMGDKQGAYSAAQTVVNSGKLSFVSIATASAAPASRDRIYLSEMLFTMRSRDLLTWVDTYFRFVNSVVNDKLILPNAQVLQLFESSGTDIRYLYRFEESMAALVPSKYYETTYIPMLRLSEMYYILAETAPDPEEGIGYLNQVRRARAIELLPTTGITSDFLENEINKEHQKEFYAEGQSFYYYKRKNTARMKFRTADTPSLIYHFPIPAAEKEFNPTY